jgi:glycosyltransferase involved in cell wall biosynthesis
MNIIHTVAALDVGGLEQIVKNMAIHPVQGVSSSVFVLRGGGVFSDEITAHGSTVHFAREEEKGTSFTPVKRLIEIARQEGACVLHCHDVATWETCVAAKIFGLPHVKIILTKHGHFDTLGLKMRLLVKVLSHFTSRIVPVSEEICRDFIDTFGISASKIEVVINGIQLDHLKSTQSKEEARALLDLPVGGFLVGTVGRFDPVKNHAAMLDMVERLAPEIPNLNVVITAPINELGEKIIKETNRRGLDKHLHFLGFRKDVPLILRALDLFILPSTTEGTSMALLEALGAGLPAVVSNVGGNPAIIQDDYNGFVFDLDRFDIFCERIHTLQSDPALLKRLASNAALSAEEYGFEKMVNNYKHLYEQFC